MATQIKISENFKNIYTIYTGYPMKISILFLKQNNNICQIAPTMQWNASHYFILHIKCFSQGKYLTSFKIIQSQIQKYKEQNFPLR